MERVMIIGSNGAGKSTFSYKLAELTGLPLIHIDQIYWRDCWQVTPSEDFEQAVLSEAQKDRWIIEGNNVRTLKQRLKYADTVLWFEFPPLRCIYNIFKREIKYRNRVRPDMPDQCVSKLGLKFLKSAWKFNRVNRQRIRMQLESVSGVKVLKFRNYKQVQKFILNMENG